MTKRVAIKKSIPVECFALGPLLNDYIEQRIQDSVGQCTQEYGYILNVGKFKIIDTEISRATTETIMVVSFDATTVKPEVSAKMVATVSTCVSGHGIYAYSHGKIKVLVPERTLKGCKFVNGSYTLDEGKKPIMTGDEIEIVITAIKYDKNNFQCIGSL